jgi:hypothetical protein
MHVKEKVVRASLPDESGNKVKQDVGVAKVQFADTLEEAIELDGEELLVKKRNSYTLTEECNKIRAEATGGTSKKRLRDKALASITGEEWATIAGKPERIEELVERRMAEIQAQQG